MSRLLAIKHSPTAITYTQLSSPKTAGNPYFFDKAGTLFKVGETVPYLGREFIPEQEESWLIPTSQFRYEREYTLEELKNIYYMVDPINKEQTMFRIWNGKEGYYNVIDRFCNEYFKRKLVDSILFSFDNIILVNKTAVYSDRRRHRLRGDGQPGLLRGERHPDLLCQTRPPIADCKREKLCETGTCEGESHNNGRAFRNAEGALLNAEDQGEEEGDGDPVHLLRNPHCQRGATGGAAAGGTAAGSGLIGCPEQSKKGVLW